MGSTLDAEDTKLELAALLLASDLAVPPIHRSRGYRSAR